MSENVVIKKDRTVIVPASEAKIGVQYDHNVNVITFDCPRYPDDDRNVDMSTMQIYINYMLPDKTLGSYLAENVKVDTNNPDTIHFDWKITRNVTQVKGALQALVCIKKVDAEGNELYHWNTDLIQSFRVGEGMECLETISSDYADVISQLLVNMNTVTGEFEALSADVTARTSEETLQGLVNNAASDEKLRTIVNRYMEEHPVGVNVDNTLTVSGDAADAKVTGDRISELKSDLMDVSIPEYTTTTGAIDTRSGAFRTDTLFAKCSATDFIDVSDCTDVEYSGVIYNYIGVAGYDENGSYVTSLLDNLGVVKETPFQNQRIKIPDGVKKIRASSYASNSSAEPAAIVVKKIKRYLQETIDKIESIGEQVSECVKTIYIYVSTDGSDENGDGTASNPYATIYHANDMITDASKDKVYVIKVADGTYTDLQERYSGVNGSDYIGVICKDYVYYEGNVIHPENVTISWDGATGFDAETVTLENVMKKSPFHIIGNINGLHTGVKGFYFDCKNLRYCIHPEMESRGFDNNWYISNCDFSGWQGRPTLVKNGNNGYQSMPSIGMGSNCGESGLIEYCKFPPVPTETDICKNFHFGIVNHDNVPATAYEGRLYCGSNYKIENCFFNGNSILVRSMYDINYATNNLLEVKNCTEIKKIIHTPSTGIDRHWNIIAVACDDAIIEYQ